MCHSGDCLVDGWRLDVEEGLLLLYPALPCVANVSLRSFTQSSSKSLGPASTAEQQALHGQRRAAKKTKIAVGNFVRIKKPSACFKGDCSFSSPTKVIEGRGPASFRLGDSRTWNASTLSRVPLSPTPQLLPGVAQPATPQVPGAPQLATPQSPDVLQPAVLQLPSHSMPSQSPCIRQQQSTSPSTVRRPKRATLKRRPPAWLRDYQTD
ncbi:hypothetical protein HPB50_005092 [Hyalomma asiaticum]|uniref:Uncharacterized protein n=1 Tax=Hyalomma asiaticum TaxID=266040 RepID=A0ACB7SEL3_HYAAI|nr:hypothetical protein HPB50_005092 [Hyalomma asiaticum]